MNYKVIASALLATMLLVACSDDTEQPKEQYVDPNAQQTEQVLETKEEQPEQAISEEEFQSLLAAVKDNGFNSKEHTGTVSLEERHMQGDQQLDYMKSNITYRQNDAFEGMYGENQLYYKKHLTFTEGPPESYEAYIQPDKSMYTYNDSAGWQGYDLMSHGEMGLERMSFLSPADVLSMLEMNESTVQIVDERNDEIVISFEPLPEAQMELLYSVLEADSFYHLTDMALEFDVFSITLTLSKNLETLRDVSIHFKQVNIDNETDYLESHYHQYYTSTKLEEEIRPPKAVFSESGMSIWD